MSQTQDVRVLAHGHPPSKTKSVQHGRRKPPSSRPSPQGEGESSAAFLKIFPSAAGGILNKYEEKTATNGMTKVTHLKVNTG